MAGIMRAQVSSNRDTSSKVQQNGLTDSKLKEGSCLCMCSVISMDYGSDIFTRCHCKGKPKLMVTDKYISYLLKCLFCCTLKLNTPWWWILGLSAFKAAGWAPSESDQFSSSNSDVKMVEQLPKCPCRHHILHPMKSDSLGWKDVDGHERPCCARSLRIRFQNA